MTLDLAALRLLSWQGPFDPCATCGQTVGHRCRTSSNAVTTPHTPRLAEAKGYDARQPEVDELQQGIDQRDQAITAANDSLRTAAENAATLTDQLKTARLGAALVPGLQQQVADLIAERDKLRNDLKLEQVEYKLLGDDLDKAEAELAAYKAAHPDTPAPAPTPAPEPAPTPAPVPAPTPTKRRTQFGACILSGSAASVPAKFGQGAAVRQFLADLTPVTGPAGSLMHLSTKALGTDAQIDAWLKGGGIRTYKHEPDNDGMTPAQIAQWKTDSNRLYDRNVALGRPCLIAPTFTGQFWSNHTTDAQRDVWLKDLRGDLFGLDFDGVHDNQTAKPADLAYRVGSSEVTNADEIAALSRALTKYAANGWTGFCVPEFGTSRATWDTTGEGRAKWMRDNAARFVTAGAVAVHYYDHAANGKSDVLTDPSPELDLMRKLVAGN